MKRLLFDPEKVRAAQEAHAAFRRLRKAERHPPYFRDEYRAFRQATGEAWPPGFWEALSSYDELGRETALRFLEEDPFFFQSGYVKVWALRRLPRWTLDAPARERIARIVLRAVNGPPYREFRWYAKAARHADPTIIVPNLLRRLDAGGTFAWPAFCAAHCFLGKGFPMNGQRHANPGPQIADVRLRHEELNPSRS